MQNKYLILTVVLLFGTFSAAAHLPKKITKKTKARVENRAFCANSESAIDQEINNVRARLLGGGDCWWDFTNGRYVVPKVDATSGQEEVSSIFAAAVWIGGFDDNGNLKLACQDYRESGLNDFWPGPLDENTGKTDADQCKNWDTHFRVTSDDIRTHLANLAAGNLNINDVPKSIRGWPARGNPYFAFSEYENSNTSNVVKITNLPARCVVSIYSLDGRFIRQYKRDEQYVPYRQISPALEWDLKNAQGIPIASGVYIVHVNAYNMGERTLKWFGVTRMFDPRGL